MYFLSVIVNMPSAESMIQFWECLKGIAANIQSDYLYGKPDSMSCFSWSNLHYYVVSWDPLENKGLYQPRCPSILGG